MTRRRFGSKLENILKISEAGVYKKSQINSCHREFKNVFPHEIIPSNYQPRREFNEESLQELADSIKEKGILQPLVVRKIKEGYELIAGERRWRAAQMVGLKQIPIITCDADDNSVLAFSLIENIQRQDLNPIEEAFAIERLLREFSMTHEEVAKSIGKSRAMVTNMLRLLKLADSVKEMLIQRKLEMGHARALLPLSEIQQAEIADLIVSKSMTAREVERYVSLLQKGSVDKKSFGKTEKNDELLNWEKELVDILEVAVEININKKGKGRIMCKFSTFDELKDLVEKLHNTKR